jgi:hypothetical protein
MYMRAFLILPAALVAVGCGGSNDYSEYFVRNDTTGDTSGTSGGAGGSSGQPDAAGAGCKSVPFWLLGGDYKGGSQVRAPCLSSGGGSTVCEPGKTYVFTCKEGAACGVYAPGAEGWWGAWTVGMECD